MVISLSMISMLIGEYSVSNLPTIQPKNIAGKKKKLISVHVAMHIFSTWLLQKIFTCRV